MEASSVFEIQKTMLVVAKVKYGTSLANVDWLHGEAEALLTLTNIFIVLGLRRALRKAEDAKARTSTPISGLKEEKKTSNYEKIPVVSNGKLGSISTGSSGKSMSGIGELVDELLAEMISLSKKVLLSSSIEDRKASSGIIHPNEVEVKENGDAMFSLSSKNLKTAIFPVCGSTSKDKALCACVISSPLLGDICEVLMILGTLVIVIKTRTCISRHKRLRHTGYCTRSTLSRPTEVQYQKGFLIGGQYPLH
ncbi:hypothetical protein Prudu_014343 [Prunus dulcis]|uniref:Uncharacterized protein n=1 Tax=Prunus dulcis TaxID=3755 RepID=A0A4Y1RGQ3_PRUDU|nr:hypothetical protein Prudu_014343 [Prunus dulcis]